MNVYPSGYTPPPEPERAPMTPQERTALKNRMAQRVQNLGRPIELNDLVEEALRWVARQYNRHLMKEDVTAIALEIRAENGVPEGLD